MDIVQKDIILQGLKRKFSLIKASIEDGQEHINCTSDYFENFDNEKVKQLFQLIDSKIEELLKEIAIIRKNEINKVLNIETEELPIPNDPIVKKYYSMT